MQLEDKEHQRAWLMREKQEERVDQAQLWFAHLAAAAQYTFAAHHFCTQISRFVSAASNSSAVGAGQGTTSHSCPNTSLAPEKGWKAGRYPTVGCWGSALATKLLQRMGL